MRSSLTKTYITFALALVISICPMPHGICSEELFSKSDEQHSASILSGVGTTLLGHVCDRWAQPYYTYSSDNVDYTITGNNSVAKLLDNGNAAFGASLLLPLQVIHEHRLVQKPWMVHPVAIAYNLPTISQRLHLSPSVIAAIYLGQIRQWNDLRIAVINPGIKLPDTSIVVLLHSPNNEMTSITDEYLKLVSLDWRRYRQHTPTLWPVGFMFKGRAVEMLHDTPGTISFTSLSYVMLKGYAYAMVQNSAGQFVSPDMTSANVALEASVSLLNQDNKPFLVGNKGNMAYPITVVIYFVTRKSVSDNAQSERLAKFFKWTLTSGKQIANEALLIDIPPTVIQYNTTVR